VAHPGDDELLSWEDHDVRVERSGLMEATVSFGCGCQESSATVRRSWLGWREVQTWGIWVPASTAREQAVS
jgi:hypothetical protein